jgi:hypothetical protein
MRGVGKELRRLHNLVLAGSKDSFALEVAVGCTPGVYAGRARTRKHFVLP